MRLTLNDDTCFFLLSVGYTSPWTALSSELGYLKRLHGPKVLLWLNLAYFFPAVPLMLLQIVLDHHHDRKWGVGVTTLVRQSVALVLCAACCWTLPFIDWRR